MKPDQQSNYWQHDPDETDDQGAPEMYAPEPESDDQLEPEATGLEPSERPRSAPEDEPVRWSAREYIDQERNGLWFVGFVAVVLGLIAVDIFLLKSYTFSALVVVMAIAVIIYARRPPREIQYTLSGGQGLYVGDRLYHYSEFKSFGLIRDGEHHSVMLIPTKRFSPGVSVYFPEEAGERIVDILGARLPMQKLKLDAIDVIVRKLRL